MCHKAWLDNIKEETVCHKTGLDNIKGKTVCHKIWFDNIANQKQELPVTAMFVNGLGRNEQSL